VNRITRRALLGTGGAAAVGLAGLYGARAIENRAPEGVLGRDVSVQRVIMSTIWRVVLPRGAPAYAPDVAERALDEVVRLEQVLSEWRPGTEISRINGAAGREQVRVGADTWAVVERSIDCARWSDGAFDPTWAALRGLWDFRAREPRPPEPERVAEKLALVDWRGVAMDARARTIGRAREGMALGLGGIAKGYALDRARAIMLDAGLRGFVLYSGGQVLVEGLRDGRPWRVGVQHPRDANRLLGSLSLESGSVSTGGDYEHFFVCRGRRYHHILDPRTGYPVEHTVAVTVVASAGLDADALDTALFVLPGARAYALARAGNLALMRTDDALHTSCSQSMYALLEPRVPVERVA